MRNSSRKHNNKQPATYSSLQSLLVVLLILSTLGFLFVLFTPNLLGPDTFQTLQLYFVGQHKTANITAIQPNCDLGRVSEAQCQGRKITLHYLDEVGQSQEISFVSADMSSQVGQTLAIRYLPAHAASQFNSYHGDLVLPESKVNQAGINLVIFLTMYGLLLTAAGVSTWVRAQNTRGQYTPKHKPSSIQHT